MQTLIIAKIRTDGGTQARAELDPKTVAEYQVAIQEASQENDKPTWPFPPVEVYHDGSHYWLADGFHRIEAANRETHFQAPANIHQGTQRDAILHAAGANAVHGLKRTPADKRRAVKRLLEDEEWGQWSDREIARRCKVSNTFVSNLRPATVNIDSSERKYMRDGKEQIMKTANIGTSPPSPEDRRSQLTRDSQLLLPICQQYAKTCDYVPEDQDQCLADFTLLTHLQDPHGQQRDIVAMRNQLRAMTPDDTKAAIGIYADHHHDAAANIRRWLQ